MSKVPTQGTTKYGTFEFPVETETVSIAAQYVTDRAERTITHVIYRITLRSTITSDPDKSTDTDLNTIRKTLSTPGLELVYNSKGFGDFDVKIDTAFVDLRFGPFPRILTWRPKAANSACEIEWVVEVTTVECPLNSSIALYQAFNYTASYTKDPYGFTTRVIAGYLEIPLQRDRDRNLGDHAENYWEDVLRAFPCPNSFRRQDNHTTDESKRVLRFTITDTEMPRPLPENILDCQASHVVQSQGNTIYGLFSNTLSATYTVVNNQNRVVAYNAFANLASSRIQQNGNTFIIPTFFSLEEPNIYGRDTSARFTLSWTQTIDLAQLIQQTGLYSPVPNTDYTKWHTSVDALLGGRGLAALGLRQGADLIIDLCANTGLPSGKEQARYEGIFPDYPNTTLDAILRVVPPNPLQSVLRHENSVIAADDSGVSMMKALPTTASSLVTGNWDQGEGDANQNGAGGQNMQARIFNNPEPVDGDDPLQRNTQPTVKMALVGKCLSAYYQIGPPALLSTDTAKIVQDGGIVSTKQVANYGMPLWLTQWYIPYLITNPNVGVSTPTNLQPGMNLNA